MKTTKRTTTKSKAGKSASSTERPYMIPKAGVTRNRFSNGGKKCGCRKK